MGAVAPRLLARAAALVAAACGVAHLPLLVGGPSGWAGAWHAGLTLVCAPCAVHLWRRPGPAAWGLHVALGVLMLAHPAAMALAPPVAHHAHLAATGAAAWAGVLVPVLAAAGLVLAALRWWPRYARQASGALPPPVSGSDRVPQA
jgi:hypothetical protein